MKKKTKKGRYDLVLSNLIFKSNMDILIKLCRQILDQKSTNLEEHIDRIKGSNLVDEDTEKELHELVHVDWLFLNSIFISLYSLFENHLNTLAKIVEDRSTNKIRIKDINGDSYIDQYRKYLLLIGEIQAADKVNLDWSNIGNFRVIRNILVHKGGVLFRNQTKKLEEQPGYDFLKKYNIVVAGSQGLIRIRNLDLLEEFIQVTKLLSDKITEEIKIRFPLNI